MKQTGWLERAFKGLNPEALRISEEQKDDTPWRRLDSRNKAKHFAKASEMLYRESSIPVIEYLTHYEFLLVQSVAGDCIPEEVYRYVSVNSYAFAEVMKKLSKHESNAIVRLFNQELKALLDIITRNKEDGYESLFVI